MTDKPNNDNPLSHINMGDVREARTGLLEVALRTILVELDSRDLDMNKLLQKSTRGLNHSWGRVEVKE